VLNIAGVPDIRVVRLTFMGELGYELHVPREGCGIVYERLMAAGEKHGIVNAGNQATGSLSLEKGYRHWGQDLRVTDTPKEAGLGFTCKLKSETDFLGRAALESYYSKPHKGVPGRVVTFTTGHLREGEEEVPLHGYEAIYRDGAPFGFLRLAGYGFTAQASIGHGWVERLDGGPCTMSYLQAGSYEIDSYQRGRVRARLHPKATI